MTETKNSPATSTFLQLAWKIGAVGLFIFGIGCFFTDALSWGAGVLLGTIFTVIRLRMLEDSINKAVQMDSKKASSYATWQFILRQVLCIGVLAAAVLVPWINPIAAVLPMFGMRIAVEWQNILDRRKPKDPNVKYVEWEDGEQEEADEEWDRWETYNLKARKKRKKLQRNNPEVNGANLKEKENGN